MSRKPIPSSVQREVLLEAGYRCAVPTCRTILAIDLHHLEPVAKGGPNEAGNLLALCPTCHALHHRGTIPAEALRVWKGVLVSLNEGLGQSAKEHLLLLALDPPIRFFGLTRDGVLQLSGLIVSGLIRVSPLGFIKSGFAENFEVALTEKGRALVEAWKIGDPEAFSVAQMIVG